MVKQPLWAGVTGFADLSQFVFELLQDSIPGMLLSDALLTTCIYSCGPACLVQRLRSTSRTSLSNGTATWVQEPSHSNRGSIAVAQAFLAHAAATEALSVHADSSFMLPG